MTNSPWGGNEWIVRKIFRRAAMTLHLLGWKGPLTEPHCLVLEPSLCYSLAVLILFCFAESDDQQVSTMVLMAKVTVAFMRIMSHMSEMECDGQLKIQKSLLKVGCFHRGF